jgi:hypothetical protein
VKLRCAARDLDEEKFNERKTGWVPWISASAQSRRAAVPTGDARHGRDLWPTERPSPATSKAEKKAWIDLVKDLADIYPHTRCRFDYGMDESRIWNRGRSVDREHASTRVHYWMETAHLAKYVCTPPNISISIIWVAPREQRCAATASTAAAEQ